MIYKTISKLQYLTNSENMQRSKNKSCGFTQWHQTFKEGSLTQKGKFCHLPTQIKQKIYFFLYIKSMGSKNNKRSYYFYEKHWKTCFLF